MKTIDITKVKAIALDLDETILHEGRLCSGMPEIFSDFSRLGVEIIIATGRSINSIPDEVLKIPALRYFVTSNGACVFDFKEKKIISHSPLKQPLTEEILAFVNNKAYYALFSCDEKCITSLVWAENLRERFLAKFPLVNIDEVKENMTIVDSPVDYIKKHNVIIDKIILSFDDPNKCHEVFADIIDKFAVEAAITDILEVEITSQGVNKGAGIKFLADFLGFSMKEVAAFGDSGNDAEMLKAVGFPVAMGNASDELKKIAFIVAPSAEQNGALQILEQMHVSVNG